MLSTKLSRRGILAANLAAAAGVLLPRPLLARPRAEVQGVCAPKLRKLKEVFQRSFDDDEEVGANVAVTLDGELVANLWGGYQDAAGTSAWQEDTLVCTMSVSKGITALCAHILIDQGKLDPQARVATYWPEFGQAGKDRITVAQLLSHMAALPIAERAPTGAALDWSRLTRALEAQAPVWAPGTKGTYHATTYGNLVGELVQRVSRRAFADFVRDEIGARTGAEFVFGCNDAQFARVSPPIPNPQNQLAARSHTSRLSQETYRLLGPDPRAVLRSRDFCRYVFPSASGVSNAHSLARIFGILACGGSSGGTTLVSPACLKLVTREQWYHEDPIHHDLFRVAMGYILAGGFTYFGTNRNTFGTAGSGGYTVFADPDLRLSFAYTPNRFTTGPGLGMQSKRLVDTVYDALRS